MALFDKYGRLVVFDASRLGVDPLGVIDDVLRIKNDDTTTYNVLWMRNNPDGVAETTLQELAKYENGAVKLWNTTDYLWYTVCCVHNADNKPTLYYDSTGGAPTNNSRFDNGYWEIKSDTTLLWYRVGTRNNEDGNKELYVHLTGSI